MDEKYHRSIWHFMVTTMIKRNSKIQRKKIKIVSDKTMTIKLRNKLN